jgi:hypothetical protein
MDAVTTGRIVHFGTEHDAALVVHVWSETTVNLAVFDHNGQGIASRTSVQRSEGDGPEPSRWHWPERAERAAPDRAELAEPTRHGSSGSQPVTPLSEIRS